MKLKRFIFVQYILIPLVYTCIKAGERAIELFSVDAEHEDAGHTACAVVHVVAAAAVLSDALESWQSRCV